MMLGWTPVAPRIVLDVSCVTRINHQCQKSWQAEYLVKLECHFSLVTGAAFREILRDSRSAKCCCVFPYKMRLQDGTNKLSEAAGAR